MALLIGTGTVVEGEATVTSKGKIDKGDDSGTNNRGPPIFGTQEHQLSRKEASGSSTKGSPSPSVEQQAAGGETTVSSDAAHPDQSKDRKDNRPPTTTTPATVIEPDCNTIPSSTPSPHHEPSAFLVIIRQIPETSDDNVIPKSPIGTPTISGIDKKLAASTTDPLDRNRQEIAVGEAIQTKGPISDEAQAKHVPMVPQLLLPSSSESASTIGNSDSASGRPQPSGSDSLFKEPMDRMGDQKGEKSVYYSDDEKERYEGDSFRSKG